MRKHDDGTGISTAAASTAVQKKPCWNGPLLVLILAAGLLSSCATPQLKQMRRTGVEVPVQTELDKTPFHPQKKYQCGPAAIATVLEFNQRRVSLADIASKVYLPGRKGSLQTDMLSSISRYGLLAYRLAPRYPDLLTEVANGTPVVVLQNLGIKWLPKWHYAVVIGYDLKKEKIFLRSGTDRRRVTSMKLFERTWKRSGYWGFLVLKPGRLPSTAKPLPYLNAAVALERANKPAAALASYQAAAKRWPNNLLVRIALANSYYSQKNYVLAEQEYRGIIKKFSNAADAYNNLASLLLEQKRVQEAARYSKKAISIGGKNIMVYRQTLAEITRLQQTSKL